MRSLTVLMASFLVSMSAVGNDGFRDCDPHSELCKKSPCSTAVIKSIDGSLMVSCMKIVRKPYPAKDEGLDTKNGFEFLYYELDILSSSNKDEVSATRIRLKDMDK